MRPLRLSSDISGTEWLCQVRMLVVQTCNCFGSGITLIRVSIKNIFGLVYQGLIYSDSFSYSYYASLCNYCSSCVIHESILLDVFVDRVGGICASLFILPTPPSSRAIACKYETRGFTSRVSFLELHHQLAVK